MAENILFGLAIIIVGGIAVQWLAWRLRVPSILLLLITGFFIGPVLNLIDPDRLFGDLLLPIVSLTVAIILFEGGLTLKFKELPAAGSVILKLVSVGFMITWVIITAGAYYILGLEFGIAALLGAILSVTGPTVIGPLLRHVRPYAKLNSVLKWEGIIIDPLGAMLAVLIFEVLLIGESVNLPLVALEFVARTLFVGITVGFIFAVTLVQLLKKYWVPDFLQNPVALMFIIIAFTISNIFQVESGLMAATVMGITLANQRSVSVAHIIEFKENLRVLLISGLFILLAARLDLSDLAQINIWLVIFILLIVIVARPAAVFLSTMEKRFIWRERVFLAFMAPRGIVAAAVASVFALNLEEAGNPQAELLVPLTFIIIIATVAIYGLSASPLAKRLKVAHPNPQGILIIGAHSWARALAKAISAEGFHVRLADTNWENITASRMDGFNTFYGNVLSGRALDTIDFDGIGQLMAITANDEINTLASLHFIEVFGRSKVYQLAPKKHKEGDEFEYLKGRILFNEKANFGYISSKYATGATIKATHITNEFDFDSFKKLYGDSAIPILLISESKELSIFSTDGKMIPKDGQTLISIVDPVAEKK